MDKMEFLPLGSVVTMKRMDGKFMIVSRGVLMPTGEETFFLDYRAVRWPLGMVDDQLAYFDQIAIKEVLFKGYDDDMNKLMNDRLNEYMEANQPLNRIKTELE